MKRGYLREVPETEAPPPEVWYLPHFPIVKLSKSTTKVRIVFYCSAKCDGISLNEVIHAGPKLQKEFCSVSTANQLPLFTSTQIIMAALPKICLKFTFRSFDQTAVEYAGPFTIVQGRGVRHQNRWLYLFTCLPTRAIYLEKAFGL